MKRRLTLLLLSLAVMLGLSMTAMATTLNFSHTTTGGNYGWYVGNLNGGPEQNFLCDDYVHEVIQPESWHVIPFTIGSSGWTSDVWSPNPGGVPTLQAYSEVAWLAEQAFSGGPLDPIENAIWDILDPSAHLPASTWDTAAATWWNGGSPATPTPHVIFYQPVLGTQVPSYPGLPQELVGQTPEPVSMILMGTFLSLAGGLLRKKKLSA